MKLLIALLALAGLSGCVAYGGAPYGTYGSADIYYSTGSPYYGYPTPYYGSYGTAPGYVYGHRGSRWGSRDQDRDGIPNRYDRDRDGDGVPNRLDAAPNNPRRH